MLDKTAGHRYRRNHFTERKELWMQVRDLKKLRKLIVIQELSHRDIARAAGWQSHSYVSRLLRGEVKTLRAEPAIAIAELLECDIEEIFSIDATDNIGHYDRIHRRAS